ncbi:MAG: hypothetical protein AB7U73_08290 [Pirellulales bacterium]
MPEGSFEKVPAEKVTLAHYEEGGKPKSDFFIAVESLEVGEALIVDYEFGRSYHARGKVTAVQKKHKRIITCRKTEDGRMAIIRVT